VSLFSDRVEQGGSLYNQNQHDKQVRNVESRIKNTENDIKNQVKTPVSPLDNAAFIAKVENEVNPPPVTPSPRTETPYRPSDTQYGPSK